MNIRLRRAGAGDEGKVIPWMQRYYEADGLTFTPANQAAMRVLLTSPDHGRVWFIVCDARVCGYVALCFGYSLELGGRDACVDELYVAADVRGRGVATAALQLALQEARVLGVRAVYLEVDMDNAAAIRLYRSLGFVIRDRYHLMARIL